MRLQDLLGDHEPGGDLRLAAAADPGGPFAIQQHMPAYAQVYTRRLGAVLVVAKIRLDKNAGDRLRCGQDERAAVGDGDGVLDVRRRLPSPLRMVQPSRSMR